MIVPTEALDPDGLVLACLTKVPVGIIEPDNSIVLAPVRGVKNF